MKTLYSRIVLVSMIALNFTFSTTKAQLEFGPEQIVTMNNYGLKSIECADLDGDGDKDLLTGSSGFNGLGWFENDGTGNFGAHNVIFGGNFGQESILSEDLDGDGDMDLLSSSSNYDITWYENDGNANFTDEHFITEIFGVHYLNCADLDGDADFDILAAALVEDKVVWYENDGNGNFGIQNVISVDTDGATNVYSVDIDGDGDNDVFSASFFDDKLAWYENDGSGNFGGQNLISINGDGVTSVYCADLDGDGDLDVLSSSAYDDELAWFENDGNTNFGGQNIISLSADGCEDVYCEDLDQDGDMDVLCASWFDNKIAWYENDGNGNFGWEKVLSENINDATHVVAEDIDEDGDMDILATSCTANHISWFENLYGEGCMDPEACNFDNAAFIDNGSCCYGVCGCTDPSATNYNSEAQCIDGSCLYTIYGFILFDENENSIWDGSEYGLPNQQVIIHPEEWISYTNDEGIFSFVGSGQGFHEIELIPEVEFPFVTTENPKTIEINWNTPTEIVWIGVSNVQPTFGICVDLYPSGMGYPCNDWANHNICFRNEGNVPIDGIVEVEFDPLFQNYQEVNPIDSVIDNHIYMSFDNLLPGQMFFYDVELLTPTVDYIGQFISSTARVFGYYQGQMVSYGQKTLTVEMTCSYDPNDMQVFPNGYEEPHFIWNNTELEYLIRFQNTGNASATNVLVTDTIDENLDLSTFILMANSHSVITTIRPDDRVIEFLFQNIMLPDSGANEPESHGMISYKIKPYTNLAPGTVLHNTGNIYFDNNPSIITNTTWNTIYECSQNLATVDNTDDLFFCLGETASFFNSQDYIESYNWMLDGEYFSGDSLLELFTDSAGEHEVVLQVSNPLCEASSLFNFYVEGSCIFNACAGDFSDDGLINTDDLILLVGSYACQINCQFDLTNDDEVNMADFLYFIGQYGNICP